MTVSLAPGLTICGHRRFIRCRELMGWTELVNEKVVGKAVPFLPLSQILCYESISGIRYRPLTNLQLVAPEGSRSSYTHVDAFVVDNFHKISSAKRQALLQYCDRIVPARALFGAKDVFLNVLESRPLQNYFKDHWGWTDPLSSRHIMTLAWDFGERAIQNLRKEHRVIDEARSNRATEGWQKRKSST